MHHALPTTVAAIVRELSLDDATQSIWLVGSRANACARLDSDWDLLVFSLRIPAPRPRRSEGVDVIHVGPESTFLLEGQGNEFVLPFANWNWRQESELVATYTSLDFTARSEISDVSDQPAASRAARQAMKVWPLGNGA